MINNRRLGAESRAARFQDMYELFCDGWTYSQIGEKYKITRERVRQILNKNSNDTQKERLRALIDQRRDNSWRYKEVWALLDQGLRHKDVAKILNISVPSVKRISSKRKKIATSD